MAKSRQILDAIHGYIDVPEALASVLDSPAVQRLRRVSQTALVSTVYPSANGTRFEHALGAMHLAQAGFVSAWSNTPGETRDLIRSGVDRHIPGYLSHSEPRVVDQLSDAVAAVGLLHDVGHPPFSHALEEYFRGNAEEIFRDTPTFFRQIKDSQAKPFHELAGEAIVDSLADYFISSEAFQLFRAIYFSDPDELGWASAMHSIVANTIDIDRLDYIMRDGHHAGTEYGSVDWRRLVGSMEFRTTSDQQIRLALGLRARSAAELLLVQRMQAFRWMYRHPRVVAVEALLSGAMRHLDRMRNEVGLSDLALQAVTTLLPPLNYIRESSSYRISGLAMRSLTGQAQVGVSDLQLELPLEIVREGESSDPSKSIFSEIQASIHDDSITRYCSSVAVCFRHEVNQGSNDKRIWRYLHLYDSSLRRSTALVVLWKRHEEFADVATGIFDSGVVKDFRGKLAKDASEVLERLRRDSDPQPLSAYSKRSELLLSDPVLWFNYMGFRALHRFTEQIGDWLTEHSGDVSGNQGFWFCTFSSNKNPLHSMQRGVHLEGSGGVDVSLRDSSPLVASIDDVEDRSAKFHVFFVITGRTSRQAPERSELRRRLRQKFKDSFPVFLRDYMNDDKLGTKASLHSLYKLVSQRGADPRRSQ